jgi:hypothetical protein
MTVMTSAHPRQRTALRRQVEPIREIEDLYHRLGWLMPDVCGGRPAAGDPMPAGAAAADAEETDDSYFADINLPGVAVEDLKPKYWVACAGRSAILGFCWRCPRRSTRTTSKRSCPTGTDRPARTSSADEPTTH